MTRAVSQSNIRMMTSAPGCLMCHSLYVKANGEMPCWDDVGEELILRTLNEGALRQHREPAIFHGAQLEHIRRSFLEGREPHPGVCDRCAVRGHGSPPSELHPRTMEVLHLEASYLCHLSCPQCIPARDRRNLKGAPYNMTPALLEGLLEQLRREGVERIGFIHFEGRGDPLVNPNLSELIALSKRHFPRAFVGVTTHCSYPYMPWIVSSGLDMLRVSIDGATTESYARYRVGGDFERTMEFLKQLRDDRIRHNSVVRVEWKYILFEWNDSDDEMRRAADLARDLQVHLTFVLTHSPGRSVRFKTSDEWRRHVLRVVPCCAIEETFQLQTTSQTSVPSAVIAEHVAGLLSLALDRIRAGKESEAVHLIGDALKRDPGVAELRSEHARDAVREALPTLLKDALFPSTLT